MKIIGFSCVERRIENPQRAKSTPPVFSLVRLAKTQFFSQLARKNKFGYINANKKFNQRTRSMPHKFFICVSSQNTILIKITKYKKIIDFDVVTGS